MEIKIAICDDEQAQVDHLSVSVRKWARENDIKATISPFVDAETFLAAYQNISSDIILLDIQMPKINGVELAEKIRKEYKDDAVQLIFITGFAEYMSLGYEVAALHYLTKPVKEDKLFEVLARAQKNLNKIEKTIVFASTDGENIPVLIGDIMYVESFAHYSEINVSKKAKITVRTPLGEIERSLGELGDAFAKCHRSYIVGLKHIKKITKTDVILDDGSAVPISRRLYGDVNQALIKFFKEAK